MQAGVQLQKAPTQGGHLRVSTPTTVDLPLSTLPMTATRTSRGGPPSARRRMATSATCHCPPPLLAAAPGHPAAPPLHPAHLPARRPCCGAPPPPLQPAISAALHGFPPRSRLEV